MRIDKANTNTVVTAALIALPIIVGLLLFFLQFRHAERIGYLDWPYEWDSNRYIDTLQLYQDAAKRDGVAGLVEIYQRKPAYSLTLILTGLPVLWLTRDVKALFMSQSVYVLMVIISLLMTVRRLTGSFRWGAFAAMAFILWTSGLFTGVGADVTKEIVKYQVNIPLASFSMLLTWLMVEGYYRKTYFFWSIALWAGIVLALFLRAAMLPMYLGIFMPPYLLLWLYAAFSPGKKKFFRLVTWILLTAAIVIGAHYIVIWPKLVNYVSYVKQSAGGNAMFAVKGSRWNLAMYYLENNSRYFWPLPAFFLLICLAVPFFHERIGSGFRSLLSCDGHSEERCIYLSLWWVAFSSYLIPTVASANNPHYGLPFLLTTIVLGFWSLDEIICTRVKAATPAKKIIIGRYLHFFGVLAVLCSLVFAARTGYAFRKVEAVSPKIMKNTRSVVSLRKEILNEIVKYIADYAEISGKSIITVLAVNSGPFGHDDIHNMRIGLRMATCRSVELFYGFPGMVGFEIDADLSDPTVKKALGYHPYLKEFGPGKEHRDLVDRYYQFVKSEQIAGNVTINFYNGSVSDDEPEYEWP